MPTVELHTNIVLFLFFFILFSKSDNAVVSFHRSRAKEEWEFVCVLFEKNSGSLEEGQTVQIPSAQNNCKYLGPQLSHTFTTVETCQATKRNPPKLMWFHSFLMTGSSAETGLSPLLFLPVPRVQNFNVSQQNWAPFYFWTVPAELCRLDCTLTFFFFSTQMWLLGFMAQQNEIKIALQVFLLYICFIM